MTARGKQNLRVQAVEDKSIRKHDVTAVILAGGRGQRMGGQDKGLVELWGRPLLDHVIGAVKHQVGEIVISANRNLDRYRAFDVPVLSDQIGESWGPLAGMATALRTVDTPYVLTVPCDTPCLPGNLVERMSRKLASGNADLCVAHDGQRLQNTIALLPCKLADDLESYLESGSRKVETWLRQHNMVEARFSDQANTFLNVNSVEQLEALEAQRHC
ncbi:MAG: molybdenum cofactor guanylyltransferase MobA, partial [Acidiferrobacterales bacterium]